MQKTWQMLKTSGMRHCMAPVGNVTHVVQQGTIEWHQINDVSLSPYLPV